MLKSSWRVTSCLMYDSPSLVCIRGVPGLPASLHPKELVHPRSRPLACALPICLQPEVQREKPTFRGQERLEERVIFAIGRVGRGAVSSALG